MKKFMSLIFMITLMFFFTFQAAAQPSIQGLKTYSGTSKTLQYNMIYTTGEKDTTDWINRLTFDSTQIQLTTNDSIHAYVSVLIGNGGVYSASNLAAITDSSVTRLDSIKSVKAATWTWSQEQIVKAIGKHVLPFYYKLVIQHLIGSASSSKTIKPREYLYQLKIR